MFGIAIGIVLLATAGSADLDTVRVTAETMVVDRTVRDISEVFPDDWIAFIRYADSVTVAVSELVNREHHELTFGTVSEWRWSLPPVRLSPKASARLRTLLLDPKSHLKGELACSSIGSLTYEFWAGGQSVQMTASCGCYSIGGWGGNSIVTAIEGQLVRIARSAHPEAPCLVRASRGHLHVEKDEFE